MAADMLSARLAIKQLSTLKAGGESATDEDIIAIRDLSETFEWLDESRSGAIEENERLYSENRDLCERIERLTAGTIGPADRRA